MRTQTASMVRMSDQPARALQPDGSSSQRLRGLLAGAAGVQQDERVRLERAINLARWGAAAVVFAVGPLFPNIGLPYVVGLGLFLLVYGTTRMSTENACTSSRSSSSRSTAPSSAP